MTAQRGAGQRRRRGGVLYAVDSRATRLLCGGTRRTGTSVPAWRDGPDVRQLEHNLVELGLDPRRQITVDEHFTATAAAIRRWQGAWGVPAAQRTGTLVLGEVVVLPVPVRIVTPRPRSAPRWPERTGAHGHLHRAGGHRAGPGRPAAVGRGGRRGDRDPTRV